VKYGLSDNIIHQIHHVFQQYKAIDTALLYGSRAKGNFREGSDIDLTLKGENLDLQTLNAIGDALDDLLLPYQFDLSIFHMLKNEDILDHIRRIGVVFYQKPLQENG
jgi:uncharacterized protein